MNVNDWKIGQRISAGYLAILLVLTAAAGYLIVTMGSLAALQNEASLRSQDLDEIQKAEIESAGVYAVWVGAVMNRDLAATRREFARSEGMEREMLSRVEAMAESPEQKRLVEAIRLSHTRYLEAIAEGLPLIERLIESSKVSGAAETADMARIRSHDQQVEELRGGVSRDLAAFAESHRTEAAAGDKAFDDTIQLSIRVAIALTLVGAVFAVLIGMGAARSITVPIARVVSVLQRVAAGDLTEIISVDRKDEVGDILKASSEMQQALRTMIGEMKAGSNTMAGATSQINASSRRNVEASQSQLSAVQETTTSSTELQETARVAGDRAREIQTTLATTAESGQGIKIELGHATSLLGRAREELHSIVGSVQDLSNRNQQIGEIIESVADVADQTQLLAVNAAIEAAKAGEVGRGFGVVASEMKALSEQSKKAAQRIRGIVGEVQRATADTVQLVETGQARLQEALDPVTAILPRVERLTVQVDEAGQSGRQIVAIVAQQGAGIEQISQAMKMIQGGVQEGLAQTEQVERAAESLTALAGKLRDTVAAYRI